MAIATHEEIKTIIDFYHTLLNENDLDNALDTLIKEMAQADFDRLIHSIKMDGKFFIEIYNSKENNQ